MKLQVLVAIFFVVALATCIKTFTEQEVEFREKISNSLKCGKFCKFADDPAAINAFFNIAECSNDSEFKTKVLYLCEKTPKFTENNNNCSIGIDYINEYCNNILNALDSIDPTHYAFSNIKLVMKELIRQHLAIETLVKKKFGEILKNPQLSIDPEALFKTAPPLLNPEIDWGDYGTN